jgi:trehalose 6-phosphate phosphatase
VPRPWDARVPDELQQGLAELNGRTPLAIITGREANDARQMLTFTPRYVIGNHGAEGVPGYEAAAPGFARICQGWLAALSADAEHSRTTPGIVLEDKTYSLSFHYRHARGGKATRRSFEQRLARLVPTPVLIHGKMVINVLPPGAPNKGEALRVLLAHSRCDRALYVGDDVTDEAVFEMRLPSVLSVRVEPEDGSAAEFFLKDQAEMAGLVRRLRKTIARR